MTTHTDTHQSMVSQLRHALHPSNIISNLFSSLVVWLIAIIYATSFSALIFHGRLEAYYIAGIGITLISAMIISFIVALFGSDHATISHTQSTAAAILATMVTGLVASAPASMPDHILFYSVVFILSLTSILTGLFFLILGVLHAGNLIRYIPYPVVGGFLAGSGWLLVQGALNVMVDLRFNLNTLFTLLDGDVLNRWFPGLIIAVVLLVLTRRTRNEFILPAIIIGATVLFYGAIIAGDTSLQDISQQGWFITGMDGGNLWQPPDYSIITQLDGMFILSHAGGMAVVIIISALHLLLNASALELVVDRELDLNRELTITGAGNALVGMLGGGIIGFQSVTLTTLVHRSGGYGRVVGVLLSVFIGLTLAFGADVITLFPRVILGGLLMYLGFNFLAEWLYDAWFKLPLKDYAILFGIFLVIGTVGFLQGVVVGIVATIVMFVVEYSRISIVKQEFSGSVYRSHIERSYDETKLLRDLGKYVWVLRLQGFIFFGTANQFYESIKARVLDADREALLYVILDFRLVRGIDVSTVVDFAKLRQLATQHGIHMIFANVSPNIRDVLINYGYGSLTGELSSEFEDIDRAMEYCENELLEKADLPEPEHISIKQQIESRPLMRMLDVSLLTKYLERVEVSTGDYLVQQNDESNAMYFIESGRVDIQLQTEHGKTMRLRSMRAGTIVGEVGFYLDRPRTASIIVAEPGLFYKLTRSALYRMTEENPEAASSFHIFIAAVVAERLSATNHIVEALLE